MLAARKSLFLGRCSLRRSITERGVLGKMCTDTRFEWSNSPGTLPCYLIFFPGFIADTATQPAIRHLRLSDDSILGNSPTEFLVNLGGPTWIEIPGKDSSRRRAIVTLLHGNEPSGIKAIHELLKNRTRPATDLGILIASVDAALHEPHFSHRFIPGEKDLNRCFSPPYEDNQAKLAENIVKTLSDYSPEAVIDTHNTSSHSEPFSVSVRQDVRTLELASLFTDSLIVIDQQLGTLLEYLDPLIPIVTVEFGGFMDPNADRLARELLHRFIVTNHLDQGDPRSLNLLTHPLRLETEQHLTVTYSSSIDEYADLTMLNTIDQLNFRTIEPGVTLGWFRTDRHHNLVARDSLGNDKYTEYFGQQDGLLTNLVPMTLFMATTDPVVANTDCLLYFRPEPSG